MVELMLSQTTAAKNNNDNNNNSNNNATATKPTGHRTTDNNRAPLSSVESKYNSATPRTPLKSVVVNGTTTKTPSASAVSKSKRKRSKSTSKKKVVREIYTPLVIDRATSIATTTVQNEQLTNGGRNDVVCTLSVKSDSILTEWDTTHKQPLVSFGLEDEHNQPENVNTINNAHNNVTSIIDTKSSATCQQDEQTTMITIIKHAKTDSRIRKKKNNTTFTTSTFHTSRENITYNAKQWEDEQCNTFISWLNNIYHPNDTTSSPNQQQQHHLTSNEYKAATTLYTSPRFQSIKQSIEKEVREGRLAITPRSTTRCNNRNILDEVYVQEEVTKLLLGSYDLKWLQLGLEIVILGLGGDEKDDNESNPMTREALKKIIQQRLLTDSITVKKYTQHCSYQCKTPSGKFEDELRISLHKHALSQIMILVFFLDMAKEEFILSRDPCLFNSNACMKSSEGVLLSCMQDCFSKQGSIIRHLSYEKVAVNHVQYPLDEYDFYVRNLAVDLKDGVCLSRLIDIITSSDMAATGSSSSLLSAMRLPATSREHKVYNVNLALGTLRQIGVPNISDITTAHIVAAHQPRVIQLLWSIILHFELPEFELEISQYKAARVIQCHARRFMSVRSYVIARRGVLLCQSLFRGHVVRTTMKRRNKASILIQTTWRCHHANMLYRRVVLDIITIQSLCRRFVERIQVEKMTIAMNNAATNIQKIWRGYTSKINYGYDLMDIITVQSVCRRMFVNSMFRIKNNASTDIQRVWRGVVARRCVDQIRVDRMNTIITRAAINIQRIVRGYIAKISYGFDLMDIFTVQSVCRRFIASKRVVRLQASAIKIQSLVRRNIARYEYRRERYAAAVCLQKVCRGWLCARQSARNAMVVVEEEGDETCVSAIDDKLQTDDVNGEASAGSVAKAEDVAASVGSITNEIIGSASEDVSVSMIADNAIGASLFASTTPETQSSHDDCSSSSLNEQVYEMEEEESDGEEIIFTTRHAASRKRDICSVGKISLVMGDDTCVNGAQTQSTLLEKPSIRSTLQDNITPDDRVALPANRPLTAPVQVLGSYRKEAAVRIQRLWRQYITLNSFIGSKKDALIGQDTFQAPSTTREVVTLQQQATEENTFDSILQVPQSDAASLNFDVERSATIILTFFRRYSCQIKYTTLTAGVCLFQARVRGCLARAAFKSLVDTRREKAALAIQRIYQGHAIFDQFYLIKCAALLIQTSFRKNVHMVRYRSLQRSTLHVQAYFRGWKARHKTAVKRQHIQVLQNAARRYLAKLEMHREVLTASMSLSREQSFAAIQIQKVWRGSLANVDYILQVLAAIKIQSLARSYISRVEYSQVRNGLIRVQATFRGMRERQYFTFRHEQATVIQALARRFLAKLEIERMTRAVSILQRAAWTLLTNIRNGVVCFAATELQRIWRGCKMKSDFMLVVESTTKMQAAFRGRQVRRAINVEKLAILTLQRVARTMITNIHNEVRWFAATEIQRVFRGYSTHVNHILSVISAIKIQASIRGMQTRQNISSQVESMTLIQRFVRGYLAKVKVQRIVSAVLTLQRSARVMIIRRINYEVEDFAAVDIQRVWRGYRANVDFMLTIMSAIKIQSFTRYILAETKSRQLAEEELLKAKAEKEARMSRRRVLIDRQRRNEEKASRLTCLNVQKETKVDSSQLLSRRSCTTSDLKVEGEETRVKSDRIMVEQERNQGEIRRVIASEKACHEIKKQPFRSKAISTLNQLGEESMFSTHPSQASPLLATATQVARDSIVSTPTTTLSIPSHAKINCSSKFKCGLVEQSQKKEQRDKKHLRSSKASQTSNQLGEITFSSPQSQPTTTTQTSHRSTTTSTTSPIPSPSYAEIKCLSKFGKHTTKAVHTIHTNKKFNEVLKAITTLEKITMQSIEDCEYIIQTDVQRKMLSILRRCNRSSPHLELIRTILSVFTNISRHPSIVSRLASKKAIDILTDIVQMFRDKSTIFALASALLERLLLSSNGLMTIYSTHENKKRLFDILSLCRKREEELNCIQEGACAIERLYYMIEVSQLE